MNTDTKQTQLQASFELVANKHNSRLYAGLSTTDRKRAWRSYEQWLKNPTDGGTPTSNLEALNMIRPLLSLSYFCPLSDKDIVMQMLQPVERQPIDRCYVMVRLSQNERPLVWVCALGGKRPGVSGPCIIRVRIGTPTALHPRYTVILEKKLTYESKNLHVILAHLHARYAPTRKLYAWTELYLVTTDDDDDDDDIHRK